MAQEHVEHIEKNPRTVAWWDLVGMLVHGQYWRAFLTFNGALLAAGWAVYFVN